MISTDDVTAVVGPNITRLDLNIVYSEAETRVALNTRLDVFLNLTYLNKAISKLIKSILTKSI